MVDENDVVIHDELRPGLTCDRRVGQEKFMATYEPTSCAEFEGRKRSSKADITIIATTGDGEPLISTRTLKCNK